MSEVKHTPTPWKIYTAENRPHSPLVITSTEDKLKWVADVFSNESCEANARFIVTACNNYERMKAMLEEMISPLELYKAYGWPDRVDVTARASALIAELNKTEGKG